MTSVRRESYSGAAHTADVAIRAVSHTGDVNIPALCDTRVAQRADG